MATTNFFKQVAELDLSGNLQMTIAKGMENGYIVSVFLQNDGCGDEAKKLIPPFNLKGTAEELDSGFFDRITIPMQTVSGLMSDMERYLKQVEEARKKSAMEKSKADKEKSTKDAKDKKYNEAMQKVDELDKEGKPRDAWMKVPSPADFPEHAESIKKRKSELSAKFAPDLFGTPADSMKQSQEEISEDLPEEPEDEDFDENEEMED